MVNMVDGQKCRKKGILNSNGRLLVKVWRGPGRQLINMEHSVKIRAGGDLKRWNIKNAKRKISRQGGKL